MKKILILALVVIIAGVAFAETDPVFSGSFKTYMGYSFPDDEVKTDVSNGFSVDLNATIDEWNTVSVKIGLGSDVVLWDDISDDYIIQSWELGNRGNELYFAEGNELDTSDNFLKLNGFTVTTDVSGAFGIESPVTFKTKLGDFDFNSVSVASVAPISTGVADGMSGTDSAIGLGMEFGFFDMVTLSTVIYPENLQKVSKQKYADDLEFGVSLKATKIADILDFAFYYIASATDMRPEYDTRERDDNGNLVFGGSGELSGDEVDPDGDAIGASLAVHLLDGGLKLGLGFDYNLEKRYEKSMLQFDIGFTMVENLALGLSYGLDGFKDAEAGSEFKFSVSYDILSNLGIFAGIGIEGFDDLTEDDIDYDAGVTASLGALGIQLGVSNNMDYKAPEDDFADTLYVMFNASF